MVLRSIRLLRRMATVTRGDAKSRALVVEEYNVVNYFILSQFLKRKGNRLRSTSPRILSSLLHSPHTP